MGLPIQITKTMSVASTAVVATNQLVAAATNLALVNSTGAVSLDTQRRVLITLTNTNSGSVIILSGTNDSGNPVSESLTVGATATTIPSLMDYKSVTNVNIGGSLTGSVQVGTNTTGSIPWQAANPWLAPYNLSLAVDIVAANSNSCIFTYTLDPDPLCIASNVALVPAHEYTSGTAMIAQTTSGTAFISSPLTAWRFTNTTGTAALVIHALEGGVGNG